MNIKYIKPIINRLKEKALQSPSAYKIAAIAFTKKGNILGIESNGIRMGLSSFKGKGKHAEMTLMKKYGKKIETIYLFRVGLSAIPRPIDPCPACSSLANKLGIKIIPLVEYCDDYDKNLNTRKRKTNYYSKRGN